MVTNRQFVLLPEVPDAGDWTGLFCVVRSAKLNPGLVWAMPENLLAPGGRLGPNARPVLGFCICNSLEQMPPLFLAHPENCTPRVGPPHINCHYGLGHSREG